MRLTFTFLSFFICITAIAQQRLRFNVIGKDSVVFHYTDDYQLTYDTCATIIRRTHFDFAGNKFTAPFKDVSIAKPDIVLAEGIYDAEGQKQGTFITRYPDGTVASKGSYLNNKPTGEWAFYYKNGKPSAIYTIKDSTVHVNSVYTEAGEQVVKDGTGKYKGNGSPLWQGKLVNGLPDGLWNAYNVGDVSKEKIFLEWHRNGKFYKGQSKWGEMKQSAIQYFNVDEIPAIKAERMLINLQACNPVSISNDRRTSAYYEAGWQAFTDAIDERLRPVMQKIDLSGLPHTELVLNAEITPIGRISKIRYENAFDRSIASSIASALQRSPSLTPASVGGKPVSQLLVFKFIFNTGSYSYTYRTGDILSK